MTGLTLRPARRDEVPQIVALLRQDSLSDPPAADDMASHLAAFDAMQAQGCNHLIVGHASGQLIIACYQLAIIAGLSLTAPLRAQIEGVRVHADHRGRGHGTVLMRDAETRARAAGCRLIQLTSNRARSEAARFYARLGFTASHIGYKKSL